MSSKQHHHQLVKTVCQCQEQKSAHIAGRHCRRATKKTHKLVESPTDVLQSVQVDAVLFDASSILSDDTGRPEDSMNLVPEGLMTSNSMNFGQQQEEGQTMSSDTMERMDRSKSKNIFTEKLRPVYLIEGKTAIVVDARPWPKRVHESVANAYKDPNPKMTPAEIRARDWLVAQRRSVAFEQRKERFRQRCMGYSAGIYCLPKSLLNESKARLFQWYQMPFDGNVESKPG